MSRFMVFSLFGALVTVVLSVNSAEQAAQEVPVVGYVVPIPSDDETADLPESAAFCIRHGERLAAEEGMPLCAGDEIVSGDDTAIGVAFLDDSAVTLRPASRLVINDYAYPEKRHPTHLELKDGCAFFSVNPRPDDSHFFVRSSLGTVEVKGTAFEITTKVVKGQYDTTVRVTNGTVTLTPSQVANAATTNAVDISSGTQVLLHVITDLVGGLPTGPITINKGNLTAKQMKAALAGAITDVKVNTAKNGKVTIKSTVKNPDGSSAVTSVTEINGVRKILNYMVKDSLKHSVEKITENANSFSYFEDSGKSKLTEKVAAKTNSGKLTCSLLNTFTGTGKAEVFSGTDSKQADGTLTGHGVSKKTGDTVDTERKTLADGTVVKTQTYHLKQADGQIQTVVFVTQLFIDGTSTKSTVVFAPGAATGTETSSHTGLDGTAQASTATVSTTKLPDGSFQLIGPPIGGAATPPLTPPSKIIQTNVTRIENPELPVSP